MLQLLRLKTASNIPVGCPKAQPLTFFNTIIERKGNPFGMPFVDKWYMCHFHILLWNATPLLIAVNAPFFEYQETTLSHIN